jgi:uncharacterized protein YbgA (DUF1722 family)/uncharacterized protein YbbK (DUF523 family)
MKDGIKIGISRCLIGDKVRYDGSHKKDSFLTDTLGLYVSYVPVCPEVECGMPVPRESMRLVGDPDHPRLMTAKTQRDYTGRMISWCNRRLEELEKEDLCGFIFKKDSPSSGLFRVKVYTEAGMPGRVGSGLFARAFTERFPLIPVEEEGRLNDPEFRENFIERIFTLKRWRGVMAEKKSLGNIVHFHTQNKLLLLSHSETHYRRMGKLVAGGKAMTLEELYKTYEQLLMEALELKTTVKKNINVLMHILGYFKKDLSGDEKKEILEILEQYRKSEVPLIVPVTLVNHYVRRYDKAYLQEQTYLHPHPTALKLRNHA